MSRLSFLLAFLLSVISVSQAVQTKMVARGTSNEILMRKDVQEDLALSATLRKEISTHVEKSGVTRTGGSVMIRSKGNAFGEGFDKIAAKLTSQQKQRLEQLKIQVSGNRALLNPSIQAKLKLTSAQKATLSKLNEDFVNANLIQMPQGGKVDQSVMAKMQKASKELNDKLGKVLTAQQNSDFKKLQGKPLKKTV